MTQKIYVLKDPRNGEPRYVGITQTSLTSRLSGHACFSERFKDTAKSKWIRELYELGLKPIIELIAEYPTREAALIGEADWIHKASKMGVRLLNVKLNFKHPGTMVRDDIWEPKPRETFDGPDDRIWRRLDVVLKATRLLPKELELTVNGKQVVFKRLDPGEEMVFENGKRNGFSE